jgi:hypothetical protein
MNAGLKSDSYRIFNGLLAVLSTTSGPQPLAVALHYP